MYSAFLRINHLTRHTSYLRFVIVSTLRVFCSADKVESCCFLILVVQMLNHLRSNFLKKIKTHNKKIAFINLIVCWRKYSDWTENIKLRIILADRKL